LFNVIGIAPPSFRGVLPGFPTYLWIPTMMLGTGWSECAGNEVDCPGRLSMIARLAPGRTLTEAQAEFSTLALQLRAGDKDNFADRPRFRLYPIVGALPELRDSFSQQTRLMAYAAAFLLIIACLNLAGLFLARNIASRGEIALRISIGAGRARLVRQLAAE